MSSTALVPSLVRPSSRVAALAADVVLVALGVTLIALSAQVVVLPAVDARPDHRPDVRRAAVGGAYGATRGFATLATYLVVGGLGVGVFAAHASGWDVLRLSSATGGYLVGMLVAATVVGWLADRGWDRNALRSFPAMVLGNVDHLRVRRHLARPRPRPLGVPGLAPRRAAVPVGRCDQDPARRRSAAGGLEARRPDSVAELPLTPPMGHGPQRRSRRSSSPTASMIGPPSCPIPARNCRRLRS